MLESALTGVAVVLALTQPVPQVVRVLRTRSVAGISGPTTWAGFAINAGWMAYGVARGLVPVAVLSGAYVIGYLVIGSLLVGRGNRRGIVAGMLAVASWAVGAMVAGWPLVGTALAASVAVQFLPQVIDAWRSDDLTGLAPGTYLVCGLDGLVWGGYGLLVADRALVFYGVVMCSVAVLVLVPRTLWARRVALVGVRPASDAAPR